MGPETQCESKTPPGWRPDEIRSLGMNSYRIMRYDLAAYLASGMTEDDILKEFPYLEKADFQAVYEFFASIPERIAVLEASR